METGIGDPTNVIGMSSLVNPSNINNDVRLDELEKQIVSGVSFNINEPKEDQVNTLKSELERLTSQIGVPSSDSLDSLSIPINAEEEDLDFDNLINNNNNTRGASSGLSSDPFSMSSTDPFSMPSLGSVSTPLFENDHQPLIHQYQDSQLNRMTDEQRKQDRINEVLKNIGGVDGDGFSIDKEKLEDDRTHLVEQIDALKQTLKEDNVDISRIPTISANMSIKEVRDIHKILLLKNDRKRYHTLAEEVIIGGAELLESIFDGNRVFLNRYQPDLTGWHSTIRVKLRRMRFETSTVVSDIMQDYNFGPKTRIALEILPSLFTHTRIKRRQSTRPKIQNDIDISEAISKLRDIEA